MALLLVPRELTVCVFASSSLESNTGGGSLYVWKLRLPKALTLELLGVPPDGTESGVASAAAARGAFDFLLGLCFETGTDTTDGGPAFP